MVLSSLSAPHEKDIVKGFIFAAKKILKADFGFSFIRNHNSQSFSLLYKDSFTPYTPQVPRKSGITSKVFKSGETKYITLASDHPWVRKDAKQNMKGVVVIPMSYKNRNYGTLDICFYKDHTFTSEEKNLCEFMGTSAAQAITINRLNTNLRKNNSELEYRVKQRTKQLEESRGKLQEDKAKDNALLNSIGEGIIAIDREGKIILANPQAEFILKKKSQELIGKSLYEAQILYDQQGNPVETIQRPSYKDLKAGKAIEATKTNSFYYKNNKNLLIPLALTINPIILKDEVIGAIQVFRDITQEKEIDRVKTELISLASHQLRTPLSAINWYAEALIKEDLGKLNAGQKKYLKEIFSANQKMIELVYDFLNVSRVELGTFSIKLDTTNLEEITQSVLKELQPLIKNKKLSVKEHYDKEVQSLQSDKKIVRLIVQNLVTNAVKYSDFKGKISINMELKKKKSAQPIIYMTISDNGFGIPKHQQKKIFTKLFRADNVAKLDTHGSGLGLYLVKSFVEFCKGKITFTSSLNKGTTFYVSLPVTLDEAK